RPPWKRERRAASPGLLRERESRDERDKSHASRAALLDTVRCALQYDQVLRREVTDRDDEPSARRQLGQERLGHARRGRRYEDAIEGLERRFLGPPRRAVPQPRLDVGKAEAPEPLLGLHEQIGEPLDREHASGEMGEDRRLVPRP